MGLKGQVGYPSDVTDEECAFVLPYFLLCREGGPQRKYDLRAVFNPVRYVARSGGVEISAERYAALACGFSADAVLAEVGMFRDTG